MPAIPKGVSTTVLISLVVALAILPWTGLADDLFGLWLAGTIVLTAFVVLAGVVLTKRLPGVFIDSANTMSLSRLQTVFWTLLILPAFLAAAIWNVDHARHSPVPKRLAAVGTALDIEIPEEIWVVLGISTVSLIGSSLIKSRKREQPTPAPGPAPAGAPPTPVQSAMATTQAEGRVANGMLAENPTPQGARWSDLIRGEEIGNVHTLDLGKVQMLFFTVIVLTAYGTAIGATFAEAIAATGGVGGKITAFPDLDGGMLALLGISHAGYLAYKAAPQSP